MKTKLPIIVFFATISILFLGMLGIIGWLIHNEFLLSIVPGGVRMKFNVALCFLFSSLVLILNNIPARTKFQERLLVILPATICLIALLTLIQYIFNINIGIDEIFFKDDFNTAAIYYPGRMSPIAAISFLLISSGLFLLNKEKTAIYQFFYLSGIGFASFLMLISLNFISDTPSFIRLAVHAAFGFMILSATIYFSQPVLQKKISFERKLFTGFAGTIILIIVISVFSIFYSDRNVKTFELIKHTNTVLNQAEEILSITNDLESTSRGYVITGDSNYLEHFAATKDIALNHIKELKELTKDNQSQQVRIDSLSLLINKRIDFSLQTVTLRNEKGVEEASKLVATSQGRYYMDKIRVLIAEIQKEENNLLVQRQRENDKSISSFYRALFVFFTCIFILLAVILFSIRHNISIRKKTNEQIQEQKQEIQNFIDSMSTMSAKLLTSGKILMANKIAQQASGVSMEELLNTSFMEGQWWTFDPEVHARVRDGFKKACTGATVNYDENIFVFGQILTINFSLTPILKTDGTVDYIVAEGRDITAQKKAEEKIKESEEKLSILFNSIDEGFCIIQMIFDEQKKPVDYRFLVVNPSFEKQTGLHDAVGKRMREFAPNHEEHWFETYGRIALTGESIRFENLAEQLHRWYDVYAFRFGEPKNLQVAILFNDITERKKGEETSQQMNLELEKRVEEKTKEIGLSEEKYRNLFENNPMPMWVLDISTFKFLDVNEAATLHYGYSREEFLSLTALDIRPEDEKERYKNADHSENNYPANYNRGVWKHLKKDGTIIFAEIIVHEIIFENKTAQLVLSNDITKKIKAEEKLKKTIKEISDYKFALDESSIVAITDQKGIIKYVNNNFCKISKYSREELIGQDHRIINSGYHPKEFIKTLWTTIAKGKIWKGELKNKAKDGTIYWVDTTIVPFLNEEGKPYQYVAIRADITERKHGEENLQKSLKEIEDYKYALDESSIVAITDQKGIIKYANDNFCSISKYSREELIGQDHRIINSGYHTKEFIKTLWTTIAKGKIWKGELKNKAKDGTIYWVDTTIVPFLDEKEKPYQYVAIRADITQRKTIEENLEKSLKETSDYKYALEESSIVAITDQKGIIKYANDNFCSISKYSREELIGQDHRIINSGYHTKEFIKTLWTTIAKGKIWKGELKNKAKDGTIYWVDTTIVPFLNEEGKPYQYVAIRADITDRKKAENENHQLNEELEQKVIARTIELDSVNKEMEAFTYSVSHDLRAPLRGIVGFTTILEEDYTSKLDDEAKRITAVIRDNTLKMGNLIDDLLAFSRMGRQDIVKNKVNTANMVKEVITDLTSGNSVNNIEWIIQPLPIIKADINTIRQVWVNLISNAMKYSRYKEKPHIEIGVSANNEQTVFFIKDNGVGFDELYEDKLFKVFQRLHSASEFEGTGVGLALAEKIISKHGGRVWAEGKVNKGACFYFSLPTA